MESLVLSHFDYLVLGIIALSGLIAFFRGFIQETLSLLLWIIAFAAAMFLNVYLEPYFIDYICLLYTSPSPRDATLSRMPSSA